MGFLTDIRNRWIAATDRYDPRKPLDTFPHGVTMITQGGRFYLNTEQQLLDLNHHGSNIRPETEIWSIGALQYSEMLRNLFFDPQATHGADQVVRKQYEIDSYMRRFARRPETKGTSQNGLYLAIVFSSQSVLRYMRPGMLLGELKLVVPETPSQPRISR